MAKNDKTCAECKVKLMQLNEGEIPGDIQDKIYLSICDRDRDNAGKRYRRLINALMDEIFVELATANQHALDDELENKEIYTTDCSHAPRALLVISKRATVFDQDLIESDLIVKRETDEIAADELKLEMKKSALVLSKFNNELKRNICHLNIDCTEAVSKISKDIASTDIHFDRSSMLKELIDTFADFKTRIEAQQSMLNIKAE